MKHGALERAVVDLAEGQWGLLTSAQARLSGVSRVQLTRLVDAGFLIRQAHGVYVLRGATGIEHLELRAAWLGLDPEQMAADRLRNPMDDAVVSHASAARLHQLGDLEADRHEFTLPTRKQSRRSDVRLHRGLLTAGEVITAGGLPVTIPARIVIDLLADRHDGEQVARVLASAVHSRSIDLDQLAPGLSPFAARFGLPVGEGGLVLEHLLELGGAADQVVADHLVSTARAASTSVVEFARVLSTVQTSVATAEIAPALAEFARVLSTVQTSVATAELAPALAEFARVLSTVQTSVATAEIAPALAEFARVLSTVQTSPALTEAAREISASAAETRRLDEWRVIDEGGRRA